MLLLLVVAFALRTYQLNYTDVEGDEAFSYSFSLDSLEGIVRTTLTIGEPHPVGSYFFLHFWLELAGHNEFGLRFPSAWFGVLTVAIVFRLARKLHLDVGDRLRAVPAIAAVLVAFSPFLIGEARDGRMYSMSLGITALSTLLCVELLSDTWPPGVGKASGLSGFLRAALPAHIVAVLIAYILTSWAALNVHYFAGTILVAQNIYVLVLLVTTARRQAAYLVVRWVIAQLAILAAFAPWYFAAANILRTYPGMGILAPELGAMLQLLSGVFTVGEQAAPLIPVFAVTAAIVLLYGVVRLCLAGSQPRLGAALPLLCFLVPFVMAYLDSRNRATFTERQLIASTIGFYLLLAAGIAPAWRARHALLSRSLQTAVPGVLCVAVLAGTAYGLRGYYFDQRGRPTSWRPFMQLVQRYSANLSPGQLRVGQNNPDPGMTFYYRGTPQAIALPFRAKDLDGSVKAVHDLAAVDVERVIMRMDAWNWWNGWPDTDIAQTALSTAYTKIYEAFTGRWTLLIYSRIDPSALKPVGISFSNGVRLDAARTRGVTDMRTDIKSKLLEVHLRWTGDAARLKGSEKLFIHIVDKNGQVPSQLDVPLTAQDVTGHIRTYAVPLADSLPAGSYVIRVGLYDPGLAGAPRLRTDLNTDSIQIGALAIAD